MAETQLRIRLNELTDRMKNAPSEETVLIEEFRNNKYKEPLYAYIVAIMLSRQRNINEELAFHLFCHSVHLGMFSIALSHLQHIQNDDFFKIMLRDFPMPEGICIENDLANVEKCIEEMSDRDNAGMIFDAGMHMLNASMKEGEDMVNKALAKSDIRIKPRLILKYYDTLIELGMRDKALSMLSLHAENTDAHPSILYRYANILESTDRDMALVVYRRILEKHEDYLDTEEKISNLTNNKKNSKIRVHEVDDEIHFS